VREPLLASLLILLFVCGVAIWTYRGLLMSLAVRFLASRLPNAAKRHGLSMGFGNHAGTWIRLTLQADLGKTLSEVVGYPLEAAAYSRFAGFNLSRLYSDFMNPDSLHYQCWLGAYAVFDNQHRRTFGFDERGEPIGEEAVAVLEADQRLVYRSAGCPHRFPDGNAVRLRGQFSKERIEEDGTSWWCVSGTADTWSAYHRGANPSGTRLRSRVYGVVPNSASHGVDDFHPLRYQGEFWMRYFPQYKATCAKFYIRPLYIDRDGNEVRKGYHAAREYRKLLRGITFTMGSQS
jgi:hypothetical protein